MASAILRSWEHIGYNSNTGTIIAIARKSIVFARSTDFGVTWQDVLLPQPTFLNNMWYSGIECEPISGTWAVTVFNGINPGGIIVSSDDGLTWRYISNKVVVQVAEVANNAGSSASFSRLNNIDCLPTGGIRYSSVAYGGGQWLFGCTCVVGNTSPNANDPTNIRYTNPGGLIFLLTNQGVGCPGQPNKATYQPGDLIRAHVLNSMEKSSSDTLVREVGPIIYCGNNIFYFNVFRYPAGAVRQNTDATCIGVRSDWTDVESFIYKSTDPLLFNSLTTFKSAASGSLPNGGCLDQRDTLGSTKITIPNEGPNHRTALCYDNSEHLIVGVRNKKFIVTSEDLGTNWIPSMNPALETYNPYPPPVDTDFDIKSIAAANGVIIATMDANTDKIYRSIDRGHNWTQITLSEPGLWTVKHCGNRFVAVAFNSNKTARSLTLDEV